MEKPGVGYFDVKVEADDESKISVYKYLECYFNDDSETLETKQVVLSKSANSVVRKLTPTPFIHRWTATEVKSPGFADKLSRFRLVAERSPASSAGLCANRNRPITQLLANESHACDICHRKFGNVSSMNRHRCLHFPNQIKLHKCIACNKRFAYPSELRQHFVSHMLHKNFVCHICSKQFLRLSNLKLHIAVHTGERRHQCQVCSKRFTQSSALKRHYMTHTNERPFECEVCQARFAQSAHIKRHYLIHTEEKPFSCEVCFKQFTRHYRLKKHSLLHTQKRKKSGKRKRN